MSETRHIMGMPITVEVVDDRADALRGEVFAYFEAVDRQFSTYRADSEISDLNSGRLAFEGISPELREVLDLAELTRCETDGYFDIRRPDGTIDPSGIVKGWAIRNAARLLQSRGAKDFFVDAGGDVQSWGHDAEGQPWSAGIRNPFNQAEIIKVVYPHNRGIATSGTSARGQHIWSPHRSGPITDVVSITVIGPDVLEADRFATAAFAMGKDGIYLIETHPGLEGYQVGADGTATMTSGFEAVTRP